MESQEQTILLPRQRQRAPKVRTGCLTCKSRRLKCDEEKPSCRRCRKAKIPCEGYKPPKVWLFEPRKAPDSKNEQQDDLIKKEEPEDDSKSLDLYPAPIKPNVVAPCPYWSFGSQKEQAVFQWYIEKTASLASSWAAAAFWRQILPQAGYACNPLKHAILALSYTDYAISGDQQCLTLKDETRGLRSYCRAVSMINNAPPTESSTWLETLLIASVAFWTFDLRNRRPLLASMHFHATTNLLRQMNKVNQGQKSQLALDVEEMLHGFSATPLPHRAAVKSEHESNLSSCPTPHFASHEEARSSLARFLWAVALARSSEQSRRRLTMQALETIIFEEASQPLIDYSRPPHATLTQCRTILQAWRKRLTNMQGHLPLFEERVLLIHAEAAEIAISINMRSFNTHPLVVADQQKKEETRYTEILSHVRTICEEKKMAGVDLAGTSVTGLQPILGYVLLTSRRPGTHAKALALLGDVVMLERGMNSVNVIWMGFICY